MALSIVPHARTVRKARLQVQHMIKNGFSTLQIRAYLHRFLLWWQITSETWQYHELIEWFVATCWDVKPTAYAAGLLHRHFSKLRTRANAFPAVAA